MKDSLLVAAVKRAVRTAAQTAIGVIGSAAVLDEVNWVVGASAVAVSTLLSLLNSVVTGLPEATDG